MILDISTPGLLFPAISLLFLAYTNRFVATGQLIRALGANIKQGKSIKVREQIKNLKDRMELIRLMQLGGAVSLWFCTLTMILLFLGFVFYGKIMFMISMVAMMSSLGVCIYEIYISTTALKIELKGIEEYSKLEKQSTKSE